MSTHRLPRRVIALYAMGQFGWSLATFSVNNLLNYFYFPAETGGSTFSAYVPQTYVLGFVTIIGLIAFGSRIFDAVTDPWLANLSDKMQHRMGKRRIFLLVSALPMTLLSALVFLPPVGHESYWNVAWLALFLPLFFLAFTAYTVPYQALLSELSKTDNERIGLATWTAVSWALGFVVGNLVYAGQASFEGMGYSPSHAFQLTLVIFAGIALVASLMPVIGIDENRMKHFDASNLSMWQSAKRVLQNQSFKLFLWSDFFYWVALTFIQMGFSYYVLLLLELPKADISSLLNIMFFTSLLFYWPINILAKKLGKIPLLIAAFSLFLIVYLAIPKLGHYPILSPFQQGIAVALFTALPLAVFAILPNAVIAEYADRASKDSGEAQAGMYFAVRTLVMKLGVSFANLLFPSIILLGKSQDNPLGVQLTSVVALFFCLAGILALRLCARTQNQPVNAHPDSPLFERGLESE